MKNQNSNSKPIASHSTKQRTKMMANENKQQEISEENKYSNSNETTTIDSSSTQFNKKVNKRIGCQLCIRFK